MSEKTHQPPRVIGQVIGHVDRVDAGEPGPTAFRGLAKLIAAQCGLPVPPTMGRGPARDAPRRPQAGAFTRSSSGVGVASYRAPGKATFCWVRWCVFEAGGGPVLVQLQLVRRVSEISAQVYDEGRWRSLALDQRWGLLPADAEGLKVRFEAAARVSCGLSPV
jgi:hypothetical protein